jgi:hypothetical protein
MNQCRHMSLAENLRTIVLAAMVGSLAISFSACQLASTLADGGNPPPPPVTLAISVCDDGTPDCASATSFEVNTVRDLVINAAWENLPPGNHIQTLEILIPAGGPYQVTQLALNAGASPSGSFTTTQIFPVAATWIPQRKITGDWTVRVSLDGQVFASQMIQLNP